MTHSFPKRRSSDLAKGERGVVGDAPLLAIGLAAIDAVVEGAIEIAVLDLLIPGDLRVEYAPERRAAEDGAKHAWIGAVLVQSARTLVGLGVIADRRDADLAGRLDQQRYAPAVLMDVVEVRQIGRAQVRTLVTHAHPVCPPLIEPRQRVT